MLPWLNNFIYIVSSTNNKHFQFQFTFESTFFLLCHTRTLLFASEDVVAEAAESVSIAVEAAGGQAASGLGPSSCQQKKQNCGHKSWSHLRSEITGKQTNCADYCWQLTPCVAQSRLFSISTKTITLIAVPLHYMLHGLIVWPGQARTKLHFN